MKILGIDPGVATIGYGIITKEKNQLRLVDYGCIKTPSSLSHPPRLKILNIKLTNLIQQHQPDIAAVEDLFFYKNLKTATQVGEARGVILLTIIQNKIPLKEFTPLQVKQATTSYGRAEKKQIQHMVKILLNLKSTPKPDDAADALAVAITCAHTLKTQEHKNTRI